MAAIEELSELADSMRQASALLADEDIDETSNTRRPSTFLNVVALGNIVSLHHFISHHNHIPSFNFVIFQFRDFDFNFDFNFNFVGFW
jgi:hypothetical protein